MIVMNFPQMLITPTDNNEVIQKAFGIKINFMDAMIQII